MSNNNNNNLHYKQATNVERRTWNLEEYETKAQARRRSGDKQDDPQQQQGTRHQHNKKQRTQEEEKEEFVPAAPGAAGPERSQRAFLKARGTKVMLDIDSKVGSTEIVSTEAVATTKLESTTTTATTSSSSIKDGVTKTGVGWHCKVCDCFLKDSHTYLDHINGRKHQRNLGYSMRVEHSSKEQVQARLAELKKERETKNNGNSNAEEAIQTTNFEAVVKAKDEELQKRKEERARKRQQRKKRLEQEEEKPQGDDEEDEEEVEEEENPDMAAMMGFAGFGGGSKTR